MVSKYMTDQADLAEYQVKIAQIIGRESLPANVGGSYFAIANKCTHGGSLANGTLDDTCIRCPAMGPCSICGPASRWQGSRNISGS